jgi:hypothetical protein
MDDYECVFQSGTRRDSSATKHWRLTLPKDFDVWSHYPAGRFDWTSKRAADVYLQWGMRSAFAGRTVETTTDTSRLAGY